MATKTNRGEAEWQRWEALLGSERLANKVAAVLGRSSPNYPYALRRNGWPEYATLLLQFMEMTPRKKWPLELRNRIEEASTPGS